MYCKDHPKKSMTFSIAMFVWDSNSWWFLFRHWIQIHYPTPAKLNEGTFLTGNPSDFGVSLNLKVDAKVENPTSTRSVEPFFCAPICTIFPHCSRRVWIRSLFSRWRKKGWRSHWREVQLKITTNLFPSAKGHQKHQTTAFPNRAIGLDDEWMICELMGLSLVDLWHCQVFLSFGNQQEYSFWNMSTKYWF